MGFNKSKITNILTIFPINSSHNKKFMYSTIVELFGSLEHNLKNRKI